MAHRRGKSWTPVVFLFVIVVVAVLLAFLIGGVWMTALLVIGLVALAFAVIALLNRIL